MLVLISGCGGKTAPVVPIDPVIERHGYAGQSALTLEHPRQAAEKIQRALARARERDDSEAIGDFGFNLAVAQLHAGQPEAALITAREVEAELMRRSNNPGGAALAVLRLAEAIALYRTDQLAAADAVAIQIETGSDAGSARATFLRGLIADDRADVAGLQTAWARIAAAQEPEHQADAAELAARLALHQGDAARARAEAERGADIRRTLLDYRSLARGLALAARGAALAGDHAAAADLYLRAGRGAAAQNDKPSAKRWLNQAISLSRDPMLTRSARMALTDLDASQ
jgi:hypothetical protein